MVSITVGGLITIYIIQ